MVVQLLGIIFFFIYFLGKEVNLERKRIYSISLLFLFVGTAVLFNTGGDFFYLISVFGFKVISHTKESLLFLFLIILCINEKEDVLFITPFLFFSSFELLSLTLSFIYYILRRNIKGHILLIFSIVAFILSEKNTETLSCVIYFSGILLINERVRFLFVIPLLIFLENFPISIFQNLCGLSFIFLWVNLFFLSSPERIIKNLFNLNIILILFVASQELTSDRMFYYFFYVLFFYFIEKELLKEDVFLKFPQKTKCSSGKKFFFYFPFPSFPFPLAIYFFTKWH